MAKKILIVSGHTDLNDSVANKCILEELHSRLPEAEMDYLSELYPDYRIDVAAEQKKLVAADIVVLQFPVFWYSQPSLLHRWMEEVFKHGFSHGSQGKALAGKRLIASFTSGAPADMYSHEGAMGHTIEEMIMPPIEGTARLTGMVLAPFVYTGGVSYATRNDKEALAAMVQRSQEHAARLISEIKGLM